MKARHITALILLALPCWAFSQDKPAYEFFDDKGKSVSYKNLIRACNKADVVFFGEEHNNPIAHWLQVELLTDLHKSKGENLVLGAEMFERDDQILLDEYLAGVIRTKNFEEEAKLWNNYKTDYKPLVEFAKTNELPFIGTNIPRRYASLVGSKGIEALASLSDEGKRYVAPLPIEVDLTLPGYQNMMKMMEGHGGPVSDNFPKAQAAKDATMAWSIAEHWENGKTFLHFNGSYHSDNREGIIWYLNRYEPQAMILTISMVSQDSLDSLEEEYKGKADFIIVVPSTMTKTY